MAGRITNKWTEDLKGAFGDTQQIRKAIEGEQLWEQHAKLVYSKVINHGSDKSKQTAGVDFTVCNKSERITYDVKANMKWGFFYVENNANGWLRSPNKKTDRIVHIDIYKKYACEYSRQDMIDYLDMKGHKHDLVKLNNYKAGIKSFIEKYWLKNKNTSKSKSRPKFSEKYVHTNAAKYYNPYNITIKHGPYDKAWDTDKYPMEEYDDVTDTFNYPYGEVRGFSDSD
jgi:hypothetical protein